MMALVRPTGPFGSQSVEYTPDLERIKNLPRRTWTDEEGQRMSEVLTRELKTPRGTRQLRPVQAISLLEMMEMRGLFGPQRVGSGKSLTSYLAAHVLEAKRPILLMPAALLQKAWNERRIWSEHFFLPTNLQFISFESLGLVQNEKKLEYICPDLVIADECHYLKSLKAGRTRRIARYMHSHPETMFVALSGTIMKSSLNDMGHILHWCLKDKAPIPLHKDEVKTWAECLDEKVNPLSRRKPGALLSIGPRPPEARDDQSAARMIFRDRLLATPGVVASSKTDGVTCSIQVRALHYDLSPTMEGHFKTLRELWETPCGKAFSEATEFRAHARELGLGFSYTWIAREKIQEWDALVNRLRQNRLKDATPTISNGKPITKNTLLQEGQQNSLNYPQKSRILPELKNKLPQSGGESDTPTGQKPAQKSPTKSTKLQLQQRVTNTTSKIESFITNTTSRKNTDSNLEIITDYSNRRAVSALCVEQISQVVSPADTEKRKSIIVTPQEEFEDCSARPAIWESDISETMPLGLDEPMLTFLDLNRAPADWLNARREWCSFVRDQISRSQKYDTMLQVANACDAGLLPAQLLNAWRDIEPTYKPLTRAIFYDTSALDVCVAWMKREKGIVWVEHRAFGEALSRLTGAPYFGAGGLDASGNSVADVKPGRAIICSIAAVGQGFNLQMFSKALITSCPSGAATMEQVLGRIHRDGQEADEVIVDVLLGCSEHAEAFERAVEGAKATEEILGHSQKLCLADIVFERPNKRGPLWA
jgi:hypothetical protein